ncbi:hypothetical protein SXCC_03489 [Gluconacetobacter sp. SXCC-1]|uniref:ATP-binding protein n=1 Tax=Komagataeibacter rhaeticus TaxID=215221 RepID=A0A858JJD7_9PROT|nr:ATP-binding protein [Komagataeibacter rhaeticus]EGG76129.1 hypothetical protein SXCC_03489 [Gluconacetobacter sp. SXCC-1]QIP36696.1 ATP-binding protein [Komagataeibacter rhaeticus]QOC46460.1 ATP-binding protein [Komagataeibacter rhaeticus]WPP23236.1 ATP-binding protein [Komagataeibacter rhaeticus]
MVIASTKTPQTKPMRAGGKATEAGMAFQAAVATWFAVHILARIPVGGRFNVNNQALPVTIRLETGTGLDDIEVTQSDGGALHVQNKTSATLATGEQAPLTKTGAQLAEWIADAKAAGGAPDPTSNAAVLAVRSDAARTLDDLEAGCRAFDLGGDWAVTKGGRNGAQRRALDALETIVTKAWTAVRKVAPTADDLTDMARTFHVARFSMDEGDTDWREASTLLGRHLYGSDAAGEAPLRDLRGIMRELIGNGAPANRDGLLRALRRRGHIDVGAPRYDEDIGRLRSVTAAELDRLAVHGELPLAGGITITRESDAPMVTAIKGGSLLVVGEPGAGKTGTLVHAAKSLIAEGALVIFLSVDRFPGVAIAADLNSELRLGHDLVEILSAMPGSQPRYLIIDALDAARGGLSEGVFTTLIERTMTELAEDWTVVASIRTFDLRNGRRYRAAFAGTPANDAHADATLGTIRHFSVSRLTDGEVAAAGTASAELTELLASASEALAELLRNVFNLSLAAELLADGADPAGFAGIATQSGLIDTYEDRRMPTTGMTQAAAEAVTAMVASRRLAVRKVDVRHVDVDQIIQAGVLAATGDLVSFSHHVLFDHVAGRFYLAWHDPDRLIAQLDGDTSTALQLAPALRFAIERIWSIDAPGRPQSWKLVCDIFSATKVDPVLGNVALRTLSNNVTEVGDLAGLIDRVAATPNDSSLASLVNRLSRFVSMEIEATRSVTPECAIAWTTLSEKLMRTDRLPLIDPARVLMHALFEHGDFTDAVLLGIFGRAARAMLGFAWSHSPPLQAISVSAIRFVGKSFASDIAASRALLERVLRDPHFSQHADREAPWLTEQIMPIAAAEPTFAAEVYRSIYGQMITDTATSALGGALSRIMPLSSNRRQDYEHSRWHLGKSLGDFLAISPEHGTRAVIDAVIGKGKIEGYSEPDEPVVIDLGSEKIEFRGRDLEFNAWDEEDEDASGREDDLLANFVKFLRGSNVNEFSKSVAAASRDYATASVWTRILGVASERVGEIGDLIWPVMVKPDLLENIDTLRDAVRFVAAAWPSRTSEERKYFETMAVDDTRHLDEERKKRWHRILARLLALIPEEELVLTATRDLRRKMEKDGGLEENRPNINFSSSWDNHENWEMEQLRRDGVNMESGPNRMVFDASNALNVKYKATPAESEPVALAALWSDAMAMTALVDDNPALHDQVDRSAWGYIAHAVERVASSPNYVPGADGLPDLDALFAVLGRLSSSQYPETRETEG